MGHHLNYNGLMAFIFVILGTLMWSLDTLIRYPLMAHLQADTIVFIEHLFLTIYFTPLLFIHKFDFKKLSAKSVFAFCFIGMIGSAISTIAFTKAFSLINPSLVILLQKLQPLIAVSLSAILLNEKITKKFFIYAPIAFLGALLISYNDIAPALQSHESGPIWGYILTLIAVVGWGAATVFGKQLSHDFSATEIMAGRFIFGFIFLLAFCGSQKTLPSSNISLDLYLKILGMVVISGLVGLYLYYRGLKNLPAHVTSIAEMFFPLSAITINWIFLGKSLEALQIVGGLIIIAASFFLQEKD